MMMVKGKPTPAYKFRLICKSCNSYQHTYLEVTNGGDLHLHCVQCGIRAHDLDEVREVKS
jgi:ribosomal protein L44E